MRRDKLKRHDKIISVFLASTLVWTAACNNIGINKVFAYGSEEVSGDAQVVEDGSTLSISSTSENATVVLDGTTFWYHQADLEEKTSLEREGVAYDISGGVTLMQSGVSAADVHLYDSNSRLYSDGMSGNSLYIVLQAGECVINGQSEGIISNNGGSLEITESGSYYGTLSNNGGSSVINGILETDSDITLGNKSGTTTIGSSGVVSGNIENTGELINNGTMSGESYSLDNLMAEAGASFYNAGTMQAASITLTDEVDFTDTESAIYKVTSSFKKDFDNINGTVVANEDTTIESSGGTFRLSVGGVTRVINGEVDGTAKSLMKKLYIPIDSIPSDSNAFYGTDYDMFISNFIHVPDDYTGKIEIHYYRDSDASEELDKSAMYPGTYYFVIKAPSTDAYDEFVSDTYPFKIDLIPADDFSLSLSGVRNVKYAQDTVTISALPEGVKFATSWPGYDDYQTSYDLPRSFFYCYDENTFNVDHLVQFQTEDGAISEQVALTSLLPELPDVIFDDSNPEISGSILADGSAVTDTESTILADKVTFSIKDKYLSAVTVNGNGNPISEGDGEYFSDITINVPEGVARNYEIAAEDRSGRTFSLSLTIKHTRKKTDATVSVPDTTEGESYKPVVTTDSDGKSKATFKYKKKVDPESAYSSKKPTKPGTYMVLATIPETDNYEEITCEGTFTISEKKTEEPTTEKPTEEPTEEPTTEEPTTEEPTEEPTTEEPTTEAPKLAASVSVEISNQYYGVDYYPTSETNSDGEVYYLYAKPDSDFSETKPTEPGDYIVRAVVPETDKYLSAEKDATFSISYLPVPDKAYEIYGVMGENKYYTSEVSLIAPDGYSIASWLNGNYTDRVTYNPDSKVVYLMKTSNGAKTAAIAVTEEILQDMNCPSLNGFARDQDGGQIDLTGDFFADKLTFTIKDEHLKEVTLNGEDVQIKDNQATFELDAKHNQKSFIVYAKDEAGNEYKTSFLMMATWYKGLLIPADVEVGLKSGTGYMLDSGLFTIDGEGTIYNGNNKVFVDGDEDLTFHTVK